VAALDLVIMTDSSVAHLAGALGKPVWVSTNFGTYWLWYEDRHDNPWSDSMRLIRAKVWSDWDGIFDAASRKLSKVAATLKQTDCVRRTLLAKS
jgi:ADP-heptose:LPS heptosyltransferase